MKSHLFPACIALMATLFVQIAHAEDADSTEAASPVAKIFAELIEGAEWRTPNPDFKPGEQQPTHYAVRYHWGPYQQHVIGELVGIYPSDDGEREVRYWTLYTIYNPVTEVASALQVGWNGSMADGEIKRDEQGRIVIEQTFFGIDKSTKDVKHIEIMDPSGTFYNADVYEKDETGAWKKSREWVWTRYERGAGSKQ